jgi:hypothetical protein
MPGIRSVLVAPIVVPASIVVMTVIAVVSTPAALAASPVTPGEKREDRKYDSRAPASLARSRLLSSRRFHISVCAYGGPQDKAAGRQIDLVF